MHKTLTVRPRLLELEDRSPPTGLWDTGLDLPERPATLHPLPELVPLKKPELADATGLVVAAPLHAPSPDIAPALVNSGHSIQFVPPGGDGPQRRFFDTIKSKVPGGQKVQTTRNHSENTVQGWFAEIRARSFEDLNNGDPKGQVDDPAFVDAGPVKTRYVQDVGYATRQTNAQPTGAHFDASAISKGTVTAMTNTGSTWSANGTDYGIKVLGTGQGNVGENALVAVHILDPLIFTDVQPGESFTLAMTPGGEWDMQFPDPAEYPYAFGSATITGSMKSNMPGLADLASWTVTMNSVGNVGVTFTSNPALGLDDGAMNQAMLNGFTYLDGQFSYAGPDVSLTATMPAGPLVSHGLSGAPVDVSFSNDCGVTLAASA